mmetsp:Transcript_850/g.2694  ORF Transcript_850/g.2694 Transcript_850/m.2694 type:complete len:1584 (-) Transcript_850:61-4812(-)
MNFPKHSYSIFRKRKEKSDSSNAQSQTSAASGAGSAGGSGMLSTGLDKSHLPEGVEREVRVIVIGARGTGKTSLIRRYVENSFTAELPPQQDSISTFYHLVHVNKQAVQLRIDDTDDRIWDEQNNVISVYESFFRMADGVIVLYDVTNQSSFDRVRILIQKALHLCSDDPDEQQTVLIAGSKIDLSGGAKQVVDYETAKKFAKLFMFEVFEFSAKNSIGVDEIFHKMLQDIMKRPPMTRESSAEAVNRSRAKNSQLADSGKTSSWKRPSKGTTSAKAPKSKTSNFFGSDVVEVDRDERILQQTQVTRSKRRTRILEAPLPNGSFMPFVRRQRSVRHLTGMRPMLDKSTGSLDGIGRSGKTAPILPRSNTVAGTLLRKSAAASTLLALKKVRDSDDLFSSGEGEGEEETPLASLSKENDVRHRKTTSAMRKDSHRHHSRADVTQSPSSSSSSSASSSTKHRTSSSKRSSHRGSRSGGRDSTSNKTSSKSKHRSTTAAAAAASSSSSSTRRHKSKRSTHHRTDKASTDIAAACLASGSDVSETIAYSLATEDNASAPDVTDLSVSQCTGSDSEENDENTDEESAGVSYSLATEATPLSATPHSDEDSAGNHDEDDSAGVTYSLANDSASQNDAAEECSGEDAGITYSLANREQEQEEEQEDEEGDNGVSYSLASDDMVEVKQVGRGDQNDESRSRSGTGTCSDANSDADSDADSNLDSGSNSGAVSDSGSNSDSANSAGVSYSLANEQQQPHEEAEDEATGVSYSLAEPQQEEDADMTSKQQQAVVVREAGSPSTSSAEVNAQGTPTVPRSMGGSGRLNRLKEAKANLNSKKKSEADKQAAYAPVRESQAGRPRNPLSDTERRASLQTFPGDYESPRTAAQTAELEASTVRFVDWNQRFQTIVAGYRKKNWLDMSDPDDQSLNTALLRLSQDFITTAKIYGRIIISERYMEMDSKTIKPVNIGGHAGGDKYVVNSILFKFAVDSNGLYGGDYGAAKVASQEMKGLNSYFSCGLAKLHVPLMALVDFMGFRLIAMSLLPLGKDSLVIGSDDAARTVHCDDPEALELTRQAAERLNLKAHLCGRKSPVLLYSACDVEVHRGTDRRLYMLDFSRTLPPTTPNPKVHNGHLFNMFRPEFVSKYRVPLCSDAFSGFIRADPSASVHNQEIRDATGYLMNKIAPAVRNAIETALDQSVSTRTERVQVSEHFHKLGLNMRYIGEVLKVNNTNRDVALLLLTEAAARVLRNDLRLQLREKMKSLRMPLMAKYHELVINFFNMVFGNYPSAEKSRAYWEDIVKARMSLYFHLPKGYMIPKRPAKNRSQNAAVGVEVFEMKSILSDCVGKTPVYSILLKRLQEITHISFRLAANSSKRLAPFFSSRDSDADSLMGSGPFDEIDLKTMKVHVKHASLVTSAEANFYYMKAKKLIHNSRNNVSTGEVQYILTQAQQKFMEVLMSNPKHKEALLNLAEVRCTLLKIRNPDASSDDKLAVNSGGFSIHDEQVLQTEKYYLRALEDEPDPHALYRYATFLELCAQVDRADEYYLRCLESDPNHLRCLESYALFLMNQEKREHGEQFFMRYQAVQQAQQTI